MFRWPALCITFFRTPYHLGNKSVLSTKWIGYSSAIIYGDISHMLQPVPKRSDYKAVRRGGSLTVGERRLRKAQTESCTVSNRVFYKELKEGACKIIDKNITLLT